MGEGGVSFWCPFKPNKNGDEPPGLPRVASGGHRLPALSQVESLRAAGEVLVSLCAQLDLQTPLIILSVSFLLPAV